MTKKELVREHLERGNSITPSEALALFGSMSLAQIIHKLKKEGHRIESELAYGSDRLGNAVRYARYRLIET